MSAFKYFYLICRRTLVRERFRARGRAGRALEAAVTGAALFAALALALAAAGRAEAQQGGWQPAPPMPTPRRLLAAAALDGKAYALGGCGSACFEPPLQASTFEETRVEVYDPASHTWDVKKNPMRTILFGAAAVAPGNGKIYTLGGVVSGNVVQEYDPVSDSWTLGQPMPTARYGLAAVALDGKIYALGGNGPSNAVEVYDPATDSWSSGAPLPTARVFLAAVALGGKVYAIGGSPDCCGGSQTDVVEVYDPATDQWSTAAPLPIALQLSAAVGFNGLIYTFGGFIPGSGVTGATFQYTPDRDAWTRLPDMLTPRDEAPAVVLGVDAYVLGGAVQCHCQALPNNERKPLQPVADLAVKVTGGALGACEPAQLRIVATNFGPDFANGALVEDQFPTELTRVAWTCTPAALCGATSGSGNIEEHVDLPAGGSVIYDVRAKFAASAAGTFTDLATVTPPAGVFDPRLKNNRFTFRGPIGPATADLRLRIKAPPTLIAGGAPAPSFVTVTNLGPCVAEDTILTVTLGPGLKFVIPPEPSGCTGPPPALTCSLGRIGLHQRKRISTMVEAPCDTPGGPVPSLAQVTSAISDPVLVNNSQSGMTKVEVVANYTIVKAVSSTLALTGSRLTYQLDVTKDGPSCPVATVIDDFAPALIGGVQWCLLCQNICCTQPQTGNLLAMVDLAPPQASATFLITAQISPSICDGPFPPACLPLSPPVCLCGTVPNTACVEWPAGVDLPPHKDCSTVATMVLQLPPSPP
jgi:N-acetylneuraminic acid mutarotase